MLLILTEAVRCIRLFQSYKAEQKASLQAERAQIEQQRAETQRMMEQLLAMKSQMEQSDPADPSCADANTI